MGHTLLKGPCKYCKCGHFREGLFSRNFADAKFRENKTLAKISKVREKKTREMTKSDVVS